MIYIGSKKRLMKDIQPIISRYLTKDRWFVDLFCGGCNVVSGLSNHPLRMANDLNNYLIALWKHAVDGGTFPLDITKEEYYHVKHNKGDYPEWYVGYVGFICSSMGGFFKTYAGKRTKHRHGKANVEDVNLSQRLAFVEQIPSLRGVQFSCRSYDEVDIPPHSVIYCDPPYANAKKNHSKYISLVDMDSFWEFCRRKTKDGHDVIVSEYSAPSDFVPIFGKKYFMPNFLGGGKEYHEKVFVHESIADKYQMTLFPPPYTAKNRGKRECLSFDTRQILITNINANNRTY